MRNLLLGSFKYHEANVRFTCTEDETKFKIKIKGYLISSVKEFEELGPARDYFQEICSEILSRTSRSDVSMYMQQKAKYI